MLIEASPPGLTVILGAIETTLKGKGGSSSSVPWSFCAAAINKHRVKRQTFRFYYIIMLFGLRQTLVFICHFQMYVIQYIDSRSWKQDSVISAHTLFYFKRLQGGNEDIG